MNLIELSENARGLRLVKKQQKGNHWFRGYIYGRLWVFIGQEPVTWCTTETLLIIAQAWQGNKSYVTHVVVCKLPWSGPPLVNTTPWTIIIIIGFDIAVNTHKGLLKVLLTCSSRFVSLLLIYTGSDMQGNRFTLDC